MSFLFVLAKCYAYWYRHVNITGNDKVSPFWDTVYCFCLCRRAVFRRIRLRLPLGAQVLQRVRHPRRWTQYLHANSRRSGGWAQLVAVARQDQATSI